MPARSKKQQMAAGAALAAKRGERSKASLKGASREMVDTMSEQQLREIASTKRRGLPRKRSSVSRSQAAMAARARASSCLRRATRLASPLHALGAFASVRLEKDVEIFTPVVVGDLLTRLDLLPRAQDHLALDHVGFGVRTARVIGIAAHVAAGRAVDGEAAVDLIHVAAAAGLEPLGLRIGDAAPLVFDDEGAFLDRIGREQPEAGRRAADAVGLA